MREVDKDSGIELRELVRLFWGARVFIVGVTLAFGIATCVTAFTMPRNYSASIVVSPVAGNSGSQLGGLGALASQLGGLSALANISVGGDSKKAESIAVLQSDALTTQYIDTNDLLPVLFESKWSAADHKWKVGDAGDVPTLWMGNQYFKRKVRAVRTDSKSGLLTLTITWRNPALAATWANDLVRIANDYLRDKAIGESERNIAYLKSEASKTDSVEARQAIFAIMQTEINQAMIARGSKEYAFRVVDPAIAPERASSPKKKLWTALGLTVGGVLSVLLVLVRRAWIGAVK